MVEPLAFRLPEDFARLGNKKPKNSNTRSIKNNNMSKRRRKTIFFRAKSKRLAKIISIKSPAAFKRSVRILRRGGLTVSEKAGLVLAQNRAKAMLHRLNLSLKERKEMRIISNIKLPKVQSRLTRVNAGHLHKWRPGSKFTSFSSVTGRHRHRLSRAAGVALPVRIGGHAHRLLKR